ncbi:MAG: Uma2 family endonuclease [Gemmatimonadaceae bacterium]
MPQPRTEWTLDMVHALPEDGNRYELIDGELLVSPSPSPQHQRVLGRLFEVVSRYVEALGGYETFFAPAAITFSARRELQPDLLVLPLLDDGRPAERFEEVRCLLLAVEVLSPSNSRNDRYKKRTVYQQQGVPEYWIVDPDARLVERWRPGDSEPEVLIDQLAWQPSPERPPLVINLTRVLA